MSCYFYFVLLPLGPELWGVLCYILGFCALLCWCISLSCVLRVCELFGETIRKICFGMVAILLLNVMTVFSVGDGALLHRPCMVFQRICVLCL